MKIDVLSMFKVWKDPVWSKVIATGILALLSLSVVYFFDFLSSVLSGLEYGVNFIFKSTLVPNWLIGFMGFCTAMVIFVFLLYGKEKHFPKQKRILWRDYKKDYFLGLEWHWTFGSTGSDIYDLHSCCPKCKYQVFLRPASHYSTPIYKCDSCGGSYGPFQESLGEIESKVRRFIQQKLRTRSWLS